MRKDQIERLNVLAEEIGDVFLHDASPDNWTGNGLKQSELTKDERGDAYWCRKVAIQTGSLLARVLDLAERDNRSLDTKMPEEDADSEINRYEKKAKELLKGIQDRARTA